MNVEALFWEQAVWVNFEERTNAHWYSCQHLSPWFFEEETVKSVKILSAVPYLNVSRRIHIIYELIIRISPIQSLLSLLQIHRHRRHFLLREAETLFLIRTFCTLQYLYFNRRNLREANLCEFREMLIFSRNFILRNFWKWRFAKVCLASIFDFPIRESLSSQNFVIFSSSSLINRNS